MVFSMVSTHIKYFYPSFKGPPLVRNIMCPPPLLFLEQKSTFLDLLISFIKPFKTSDFLNTCLSHYDVMILHFITLENIIKHTISLNYISHYAQATAI